MKKITRRKALAALGAGAGALGAASAFGPGILRRRSGVAHAASEKDRRFLITIGATGGASIIDSFLAVRESEVTAAGGNAAAVNAFPDANVVDVGPFRAVTMAGLDLNLLGTGLQRHRPLDVRDQAPERHDRRDRAEHQRQPRAGTEAVDQRQTPRWAAEPYRRWSR